MALRPTDISTALADLELEPFAEGDVLFPDPGGTHVAFYNVDGRPFPGDIKQQAFAFEALMDFNNPNRARDNPDLFMKTALSWYGNFVVVHTSFLGVNYNFLGGVPLLWETMISANGEWTDFQWRYCTRNAAQAAHDKITETLIGFGLIRTELPEIEP